MFGFSTETLIDFALTAFETIAILLAVVIALATSSAVITLRLRLRLRMPQDAA